MTNDDIRSLGERLGDAHTDLYFTTQKLQEAAERVLVDKLTLKTAEQSIINQHADDPKALGSNEAARAARIAEMTTGEREDLFHAERDERNARAARDLAMLRVQALQDQLALLQVLAKAQPASSRRRISMIATNETAVGGLNPKEKAEELGRYEAIVEKHLEGFRLAGAALAEIKEQELYPDASWEEYLERKWGISKRHAYRLIEGAAIAERVTHGSLPAPESERAARALAAVPEDKQAEVWHEAVIRNGGAPATGPQVEAVIAEREAPLSGGEDFYTPINKPKAPAEPPSTREVMTSSESNEWYTPGFIIEAVREVLGEIDLDPASCEQAQRTVRALTYYDQADDGLSHPWPGRVFMNCPYGWDENRDSNQAKWVAYLLDQYRAGKTTEAIVLVNAFTGNEWFSPLLDHPICFPRRLRFDSPDPKKKSPTQSNAIIYLGPNPERFREVFDPAIGPVLSRMEAPDGVA